MMGHIVLFTIILLGAAGYALWRYWRIYQKKKYSRTVEKLCTMLFPSDKSGVAQRTVVTDMMHLTGGRFSEDDLLDYYLKIKGLHLIDVNSFSDPDVTNFLMRPTHIRLQYFELVSFYEKYFNQTQAHGVNAEGKY